MADFDFDTFSTITGAGGDGVGGVAATFGVPPCLMDLAKGALAYINPDSNISSYSITN